MHTMIICNKWIGRCLRCLSKISHGSPTTSEILSSFTIKNLWPAHTATPPWDKCIGAYPIGPGAYPIGLTIPGKMSKPEVEKVTLCQPDYSCKCLYKICPFRLLINEHC